MAIFNSFLYVYQRVIAVDGCEILHQLFFFSVEFLIHDS